MKMNEKNRVTRTEEFAPRSGQRKIGEKIERRSRGGERAPDAEGKGLLK